MAKELMEIGGFITSGAEIVNHDASLSGNGTVDSPLGVVPGYNETVLWSGTSAGTLLTSETTLAESMRNFERIRFYFGSETNQGQVYEQNCPIGSNNYFNFALPGGAVNCWMQYTKFSANADFSKIKMEYTKAINYGAFGGTGSVTLTATTANDLCRVQKIIGINRKAQ